MVTWKAVLELLVRCLLYSLVVILIDFVVIFALQRELNQITESLSFVMLLEGGIGLTVGGVVASYSPLGAKIREVFFNSKPWTAERRKEAEKQAEAWIMTAIILVFEALFLSAVLSV
jgi:hypothetical protein